MTWLQKLEPTIKMLYLWGNPCALTENYRAILKQRFQNIRIIDGKQAFTDGENQKKNSKVKKRNQQQEPQIEIKENLTIDFCFRILNITDSIYLNDDNCKLEVEQLTALPEASKSSAYWISYTDHLGNEIKSEPKSYLSNF